MHKLLNINDYLFKFYESDSLNILFDLIRLLVIESSLIYLMTTSNPHLQFIF